MLYIVDDTDLYVDGTNAGSKARYDVARTLKGNVLAVKKRGMNTFISYMAFRFKVASLKKTDQILLQYPLYLNHKSFIPKIYRALSKKNTTVLIHDLNSLRQGTSFENEKDILNQFDKIISHNPKMTQFLKAQGVIKPIIDLELFDYLGEGTTTTTSYDIGLAGNLAPSKSKYLYDLVNLNPEVSFQLFGIGLDEENLKTKKYCYEGSRSPETLLSEFHCKYGLVWDGTSIDTCDGLMGQYEKYNNPHKLSLYISCGIPVIVWKEAAIADFVLKHGIGIVVSDLRNLKDVLSKIDDESYQKMKENLIPLTKKVKEGAYIQAAMRGE